MNVGSLVFGDGFPVCNDAGNLLYRDGQRFYKVRLWDFIDMHYRIFDKQDKRQYGKMDGQHDFKPLAEGTQQRRTSRLCAAGTIVFLTAHKESAV